MPSESIDLHIPEDPAVAGFPVTFDFLLSVQTSETIARMSKPPSKSVFVGNIPYGKCEGDPGRAEAHSI